MNQVPELLVGCRRQGAKKVRIFHQGAVDLGGRKNDLGSDVTAALFGTMAFEHGDPVALPDRCNAHDLAQPNHPLAPETAGEYFCPFCHAAILLWMSLSWFLMAVAKSSRLLL